MSTVLSSTHSLAVRLKAGYPDFLALARDPEGLKLGLKTRWRVPALLLLSLLLVPIFLLPTSDFILEKVYPPVGKNPLFGLLKIKQQDERLKARKGQAALLLWTFAGLSVAGGLVIYAPVVRSAAEAERSRQPGSNMLQPGGASMARLDDRYRIDTEIGAGAMGVVYSAFDKKLERQVALKELPLVFVRDRERRERFRREALTLAQLSHPGIVHLYDLLDDGQRMILVMELVQGGTLEDLIAQRAPFSAAEACRIVDSLCDTLEHVHQRGIVHRDLKPANILRDAPGSLKITDFGLARLRQESKLTLDGSLMGSPHYMSPEQVAGKPTDYRADIYALGVIFYELLTGEPPFVGESAAVMMQQLSTVPTSPRDRVGGLSPELADLVMALLRKQPAERLSEISLIRHQLQRLQAAT